MHFAMSFVQPFRSGFRCAQLGMTVKWFESPKLKPLQSRIVGGLMSTINMYVYIYICILYAYIYICMYVYMYVCMYVRTYVCMYACMDAWMDG
jgi:hypothetical protein